MDANAISRSTSWDCWCAYWLRPTTSRIAPPHTGSWHLWADSRYTGTLLAWPQDLFGITIAIVAKLAGQTTFVVLPRRWVVEGTLAWITRHRRCARDYERLPEHHEAIVRWSMIRITSQRLTKPV